MLTRTRIKHYGIHVCGTLDIACWINYVRAPDYRGSGVLIRGVLLFHTPSLPPGEGSV